MKRNTLILVTSIFILLITNAALCQPNKPVSDNMPSYEEFAANVNAYPYVASSERVAKITAGIPHLEKCMDKTSIEELLGKPDYSRLSYGPKGPREKWLGSSWTYYMFKESDSTNNNDPSVQVFFDTSGKAHWIVLQNINGAHEIGSVQDQCTKQTLKQGR